MWVELGRVQKNDTRPTLTHSLTAARNRLWVVAPSTLTGRRQEPMRRQQ